MTLAVHPLVGWALPLVRRFRARDGRRYVDLRHPAGHVFRLPVDYTDEALPCDVPGVGPGRLSVVGLLQLATAIAAKESDEKLDDSKETKA